MWRLLIKKYRLRADRQSFGLLGPAGLVLLLALSAGLPIVSESEMTESNDDKSTFNQLTAEEERVILQKGTEPPFSGKFWRFSDDGTYLCKRCNAPLFKSTDKFDSDCGWPSFDDAISDAVKEQPDADGRRTEIVCATCGAHLGHVFFGEGYTGKNVRHCVNSMSLGFIAAEPTTTTAYFAGGCFWGVEYYLQEAKGVLSVTSGYMGGKSKNPTYEEVCRGNSGYIETVEVRYDPALTDFETLARLFFEIHDPTQINRQGPDIGDQYRSVVFYRDDDEKMVTEKLIGLLEKSGLKVATKVVKADKFWPAEDYHQDYYDKTGKTPYCHAYKKRF